MSHGYIDTKKLAEIGESLLEEAILSALMKANKANEGFLKHQEISERAGIKGPPVFTLGGIAYDLLLKLEHQNKVSSDSFSSGGKYKFKLTDKYYELRIKVN